MKVSDAQMISLDCKGFVVKAKIMIGNGGYSKIRIPWPEPLYDRKALKDVIVNMSKTAGIAIKKVGITKEIDTD